MIFKYRHNILLLLHDIEWDDTPFQKIRKIDLRLYYFNNKCEKTC